MSKKIPNMEVCITTVIVLTCDSVCHVPW